jgi:transcriptional regulator with GAF, ATPase, and Fis domain
LTATAPPARAANAAPVPISPLEDVIRRHIEAALEATSGRVEGPHGAARLLRINPHTLRARMRKLKINWRGFRPAR